MGVQEEKALLEWINSFPLTEVATDLDSLSTGARVWEALCDIDPTYFNNGLPESIENSKKTWWLRWENLKYIHESLVRFLRSFDQEGVPQSLPNPDLKAVAMGSDPANSIEARLSLRASLGPIADDTQLLKLVLIAAIHCPGSRDIIGRMLKLSQSTQVLLMTLIKDMNEDRKDETDGIDHDAGVSRSPALDPDPELQFEERLSKAKTENDSLKRENSNLQHQLDDLEERFDRLHDSNAYLKEKLSKFEDRGSDYGATDDANGPSRTLELKIQQQADYIGSLEDDLAESKSSNDTLKRTVDKLRISSTNAQKLQDQLDVVKSERDSFAKKANAVEKYKQKAQACQDLQNENAEMRKELLEVRERYLEAEQARQQVPGLQRAVEDYKSVFEKSEQSHYELQQKKKKLELDNKILANRWEDANGQYKRDQETIIDLNDKLRALGYSDGSSVPSTPAALENGGLDTELAEHRNEGQRLPKNILQRLRSANGELESELKQTRQTLQDVREAYEEREKGHRATYEELLELKRLHAAAQHGQQFQDTESYRNLSDKLREEQSVRGKLGQQLDRTRKELEISQHDLALVDKDKRTILEEVKNRQSSQLASLQEENKTLRQKMVNIEADLAGQRELLQTHLGNSNRLVNEADKEELLSTMNSIKDAVSKKSANTTEEFEKHIAELVEKVISRNAALAKSEERLEKQNIEIQELRASLNAQASREPLNAHPLQNDSSGGLASRGPSEAEQRDPDASYQAEYIANLERETRLMASAYHTLAGRLQMNNVVLQRRSDTPNSWLNKQRQLIDQQIPLPSR